MYARQRHTPGFLKLWEVGMCDCVCVCPPPRSLVHSGRILGDMDPYDWLNNFYNFLYGSCILLLLVGMHALALMCILKYIA